jgi:hypothetical protein
MAINSPLSVGGFCQLPRQQTVGRCVRGKRGVTKKSRPVGEGGSKSQHG